MMKSVIEKKGTWSFEEDQKLRQWVNKHGAKRWAFCKDIIPGRTGKQCRERWQNNLDPDVKKGNWSQDEDNIIFDAYKKFGSCWSKIAQHLKGRTENHIKNRFYSTVRKLIKESKKLKKNFNLDENNHEVVVEIRKYDSKKENKLFSLLNENDAIIKKKNCMKNYFLEYKKQELDMGDQVKKVKTENIDGCELLIQSQQSHSQNSHIREPSNNIASFLSPNELLNDKQLASTVTSKQNLEKKMIAKEFIEQQVPQQVTQEIKDDTIINHYLQELQKLQCQLQQTNSQLGTLDNKILSRRDNLSIQNFNINNYNGITNQSQQPNNQLTPLLQQFAQPQQQQIQQQMQVQNSQLLNQSLINPSMMNINNFITNDSLVKN